LARGGGRHGEGPPANVALGEDALLGSSGDEASSARRGEAANAGRGELEARQPAWRLAQGGIKDGREEGRGRNSAHAWTRNHAVRAWGWDNVEREKEGNKRNKSE